MWIVGMNPTFLRHTDNGWLASTPKKFSEQSRPEGESLACANQLGGNSFRQSVMYFPQNTPSAGSGCDADPP